MNQVLKIAMTSFLTIILFSCKKENNIDIPTEKNSSLIEKIIKLGFRREDIVEEKDFYRVEGDIIFFKKDSAKYINTSSPAARLNQAHTDALVSFPNQPGSRRRLTVYLDNSLANPGNDNWSYEIAQAMYAYNYASDCIVLFSNQAVSSSAADIIVTSDGGVLQDGILGLAEFPSGNNPGHTILINLDYLSNVNVSSDQKLFTIAHEFGHTLGFRHTNWQSLGEDAAPLGANTISGTSGTDANSIMYGNTTLNSWNSFSSDDLVAFRTVYPLNLELMVTDNFSNSEAGSLSTQHIYWNNNAIASSTVTIEIYTVIYTATAITYTLKRVVSTNAPNNGFYASGVNCGLDYCSGYGDEIAVKVTSNADPSKYDYNQSFLIYLGGD